MNLDPLRPDLTIGVVGAGAMGRGIAQVAAVGGLRVLLTDARLDVAREALKFIEKMIKRSAEKGVLPAEDARAAIARITPVAELADLAECHVVVEAIVEDLGSKQRTFQELESVVSENCILASNTSSLSITTIASGCRRPERVAGLHFFNPVPLMNLVEVIRGLRTAQPVADALMVIARRMNREPVSVSDTPGFLVNQIGRGFTIEAAHIVSEGIADFADVDRIMRDAVGFRMGPFELMDLTGLDVTHPATEQIFNQFYGEPRFRPAPLMRSRMEGGRLGRKTSAGFYVYDDGKQRVPEESVATGRLPSSVWISPAETVGHAALRKLLHSLGANVEETDRPSADALCFVTPVGADSTSATVAEGLDPARTVAVDTLFGLDKRRTIMTNPETTEQSLLQARCLLASDRKPVTVIRDSPGFVAQRIVAMIVNIAAAIAQQGTAHPRDIDKAVTLALAYPMGPLGGFGDTIGAENVHRILLKIHDLYLDPRYRPSIWLTRRARLGLSLLHTDCADPSSL